LATAFFFFPEYFVDDLSVPEVQHGLLEDALALVEQLLDAFSLCVLHDVVDQVEEGDALVHADLLGHLKKERGTRNSTRGRSSKCWVGVHAGANAAFKPR
jgi:hypothetical protein